MILKKYIFLLSISLLVLNSCKTDIQSTHVSTESELFQLEETGWKSQSTTHFIAGVAYKATLVPIEYYILKNQSDRNFLKADSIYQSHKGERVIEVEFQHAREEDLLKAKYTDMDYESAVKYMSFNIDKDFKIVSESGDTVNCAGVNFERNFKLAPFKRILLHFDNVPEEENVQLVYNDQLFGSGRMKFMFTEEPISL